MMEEPGVVEVLTVPVCLHFLLACHLPTKTLPQPPLPLPNEMGPLDS